jgi:hypothetical protein
MAVEIKQRLEAVYAARRKAGLKRGNEATPRSSNLGRTGTSMGEAASRVGVSRALAYDAERIQREAPEVFDEAKADGWASSRARSADGTHGLNPGADSAPGTSDNGRYVASGGT